MIADYILEGFSVKIRKARKDHKCCECHGRISAGELYVYCSGIGDEGPESFKTCLECDDIRDSYDAKERPMEGAPFGALRECLMETEDWPLLDAFLINRAMRTTRDLETRNFFRVISIRYENSLSKAREDLISRKLMDQSEGSTDILSLPRSRRNEIRRALGEPTCGTCGMRIRDCGGYLKDYTEEEEQKTKWICGQGEDTSAPHRPPSTHTPIH